MSETVTTELAERPLVEEHDFNATLRRNGLGPLRRTGTSTLQINVGKRCNQACHHCHVEAGPNRSESMDEAVATRIVELMEANPGLDLIDLTGGAPELNPHFRMIVREARRMGKEVIDRCNLTILGVGGMEDLAAFLAEQRVHVVASLPCYSKENVDRQRGQGVFDASIQALQSLNALGYGKAGSGLVIDLVYNPGSASLPPPQPDLEQDYKSELRELFGIEFNSLLTLTNMPIKRFAEQLMRNGETDSYMSLLVNHFNAGTVPDLMCRSLLSVGWDGRLYDCDFNQMLDLPMGGESAPVTIHDVQDLEELKGRPVATGSHCHGCTAGAGSSCSGALV